MTSLCLDCIVEFISSVIVIIYICLDVGNVQNSFILDVFNQILDRLTNFQFLVRLDVLCFVSFVPTRCCLRDSNCATQMLFLFKGAFVC